MRLRRFAIDEVLARVGSSLPTTLVREEQREAVGAYARGMPPIFSWAVLECQLRPTKHEKLDLLACLVDGDRSPIVEHLGRAARHPALKDARALEPWARARAGHLADVHVLWMEWDAPFARPAPLQLISIDPRFWGEGRAPSLEHQLALAAAGYEATFGGPHDLRVLARLGTCIARLPAGGTAIFTASLRPRGVDVDRLFVEVPPGTAMQWLDAIGWSGDRAWASAWLARVFAPWEPAYLQIELGSDGVHPYLGIEPCQTSGSVSERRERQRFFDGLVADGVPRDALDALLAWEGRERVAPDVDLVRTYHLKCVRNSQGEEAIKAYLGVCYEETQPPGPPRAAAAGAATSS